MMRLNEFLGTFKNLAYVGSIGLCILFGVLLGFLLGVYIDKLFHSSPIGLLIGLTCGAIAGFKGALKLIRRAIQ